MNSKPSEDANCSGKKFISRFSANSAVKTENAFRSATVPTTKNKAKYFVCDFFRKRNNAAKLSKTGKKAAIQKNKC
jgi:hypothetical protein